MEEVADSMPLIGAPVRAEEIAAGAAVVLAFPTGFFLLVEQWVGALALGAGAVGLCWLASLGSRRSTEDLWPARPPGWVFHTALVPPTLGLWFSANLPWLIFEASAIALTAAAVTWAVRSLVAVLARRPWSWWYLVAPAVGTIVATLALFTGPVD